MASRATALRELHGPLRLRADRQPWLAGAARRYLEDIKFNFGAKPKPTGRGSETVAFNGVSTGNGHLTGKPRTRTALQRTPRKIDMLNPSPNLIVLPSARPDVSESYSATDPEIARAIARAQENLLRQQNPDGHWCGELIVDSTLCSDFVLFMHWSGEVDAQLQQRCVRHILKRQLPDGGWNIYYGGPSEINASVKAYFALKLAGYSLDAPFMQEARANILRLGGIPQMNTFSKLYLALARAVSVEISAHDPGGNDSSAELGAVSHLQNVVVEPGHAHPARDHQSFQADAAFCPARNNCTSSIRSAPSTRICGLPRERTFLDLAQFLPARR